MSRAGTLNWRVVVVGVVAVVLVAIAIAWPPLASADSGGQIAFERDGEIHVMTANGTEQSAVVSGFDPSFSIDGSKIAYGEVEDPILVANQCFPTNTGRVHVMNPNGSDDTVHPPTFTDGGWNPSLSADGSRVASARGTECGLLAIVASPDGSNILSPHGVNTSPFEAGSLELELSLSPNAERLAFASGGQIHITDVKDGDPQALAAGGAPSISPDGKGIALERGGTIYVIDADDGSGETEIATGHHPAFSPDGGRIVFDRGGQLYTANSDGSGGETALTEGPDGGPILGEDPSWGGGSDGDPVFECLDELDPCTKVKVEVRELPSDGWREIPPGAGDSPGDAKVHDGAEVRLTVAVVNNNHLSHAPLEIEDISFAEDRENHLGVVPLPGAPLADPVPYRDDREPTLVSFVWDTDGYAWEVGQPKSLRKLEIAVEPSLDQSDGEELIPAHREVTIRPKPVVLVHGMGDDVTTWNPFYAQMTAEHPLWEGFAVGDHVFGTSAMNMQIIGGAQISTNAKTLRDYVNAVVDARDAPQVDLIGHDSGGLVARYYVSKLMGSFRGKPDVKHLLMYGTPNEGVECIDAAALFVSVFASKVGEALDVAMLTTLAQLDELKSSSMISFNEDIIDRSQVHYAALAGGPVMSSIAEPTCHLGDGDGWVSIRSALSDYSDTEQVPFVRHGDLHSRADAFHPFAYERLSKDPDEVGQPPQQRSASAALAATAHGPPSTMAVEDADATALNQFAGLPQALEVPADGSVEHEIPVGAATRLVAMTLAPATVATELIDPDGAFVSSIAAGSPGAKLPVRMQAADDPEPGVWRLRLHQENSVAATAFVAAGIEGGQLSLQSTAVGNQEGAVTVMALPKQDDVPALGGEAGALVLDDTGETASLELVDDGSGADAMHGDGTYTGTLADDVLSGQPTVAYTSVELSDGIVADSALVELIEKDPETPSPPGSPSRAPSITPAPSAHPHRASAKAGPGSCAKSRRRVVRARRLLRRAKTKLRRSRQRALKARGARRSQFERKTAIARRRARRSLKRANRRFRGAKRVQKRAC